MCLRFGQQARARRHPGSHDGLLEKTSTIHDGLLRVVPDAEQRLRLQNL
jgi:hypothetical protein